MKFKEAIKIIYDDSIMFGRRVDAQLYFNDICYNPRKDGQTIFRIEFKKTKGYIPVSYFIKHEYKNEIIYISYKEDDQGNKKQLKYYEDLNKLKKEIKRQSKLKSARGYWYTEKTKGLLYD